jgi:thymidylate synthase (FAD)
MKIIKPYYEIMTTINREEILKNIEVIGRTCYRSTDKITNDSSSKFVKTLINRGHEAMIEHVSLTIKYVCDRGVTHEIVRHRIANYAQESTRYCNYSQDKFGNEITVIEPFFFDIDDSKYYYWRESCEWAEEYYFKLLENGATPQEARSVLPNSLKTEIVVTMNLRELRHFFKLRTAKTAHPQMREITVPLLIELKGLLPEIFDDITIE